MSQPDHILSMEHIVKTFPGVKALDDVSLRVHRGEIHAICGENGDGKPRWPLSPSSAAASRPAS